MITINNTQLLKYERKLKQINKVAFPIATKTTLNDTAFFARREAIEKIRQEFILRNKFTEGSIRVQKAQTLNVNQQVSKVGSLQEYMRTQEHGGIKTKKGKHGVRLPTSVASGEGKGIVPRRKLVRPMHRLNRIKLGRKKLKVKSRKQFITVAIRITAQKKSKRFVFLPLKKHPGIYKIMGRRKNPRILLLHDFSKTSVRIPAHPWLKPATKKAGRQMPIFFVKAAKFQLRRIGFK
jgi:hypothetical protein